MYVGSGSMRSVADQPAPEAEANVTSVMNNPQPGRIPVAPRLSGDQLARYDRVAENILQPREFAERRRSALMTGSPFETGRVDPFKTRVGKKGKGRSRKMPKGITPPISDPFHVSAPTHAQDFFNPLMSKSSRALMSRTSGQRALTAAAAASAAARAARSGDKPAAVPEKVVRLKLEDRPQEAPRAQPIQAEFEEVAEPDFAAASGAVMAADGQGPAPSHPNAPAVSSNASAYYAPARSGGGGSGGGGDGGGAGGGTGDGGGAKVDPVQDDIVAGVLVAAMAVLFGWAGYNALMGSDRGGEDGDATFAPQSEGSQSARIEDLGAPNPFPPGPIDIRPTSPIEPSSDDTTPTQLRTTVAPVEPAEADAQTPAATEQVTSAPPACAAGRAMRAYFCTASANLTPTSRSALIKELDDWGACASSNELVVRGYADTRGSTTMNAGLAASRAGTVAALLRERGYSVTEVEGVGELSDIEDERNCANQRRVDVGVKGDPPPVSTSCTPPQEAASLICA